MPNLRSKLLDSIRVMDSEGEFSDTDFRWAETKMGEDRSDQSDNLAEVYINHSAFKAAGAGEGYRDKMVLAESLHNLKNIDPGRYNQMEEDALADPQYRQWAEESYDRAVQKDGETRPFEQWHRHSRFDQVIGGFLFGGDDDIPTMKAWDRDRLPWGPALRQHLEQLEEDLK